MRVYNNSRGKVSSNKSKRNLIIAISLSSIIAISSFTIMSLNNKNKKNHNKSLLGNISVDNNEKSIPMENTSKSVNNTKPVLSSQNHSNKNKEPSDDETVNNKEKPLKESKKTEINNSKNKSTTNKNVTPASIPKKDPSKIKEDKLPQIPPIPTKPIKYTSHKHGISINFPASWKGKYYILENESDIKVCFTQKERIVPGHIRIFSIVKKTREEDEWYLDSVGGRKYFKARGNTYVIGGPTDYAFNDPNSKEALLYKKMHNEISSVTSTLKEIK